VPDWLRKSCRRRSGMKRGEVWWANLAKPVGRRPVVLLSRNAAYPIRAS
jgi:mRNA-degrading endonuclease toxin of MazEF toxin-antitoxin module